MEVEAGPASEAAHLLTRWLQSYLAADVKDLSTENPIIQDVQSDELDYDGIEHKVQQLQANTPIFGRFCDKCQWQLEHWPTSLDEDESGWASASGRAVCTLEIEAAARAGCTFCKFLMTRLTEQCVLDIFRKLEMRMRLLGYDGTATIGIENWNGPRSQTLWLNLPHKTAINYNAGGGSQICCWYSDAIPPSG